MVVSFSLALHLLAAVVWVGGMFFAYFCLRPAVGALEPPARCTLWRNVLGRFFTAVWVCVVLLLVTGYGMIGALYGGMANAGVHIHTMHALGLLMMLLFVHVQFGPFRKLKAAVAGEDWPVAAAQIGRIRIVVATNLGMGLAVVAVAGAGRWL